MTILEVTLWIELFLFVLLVLTAPWSLIEHFWALMNLARVRDLPGQGLTKHAAILGTYMLLRGYVFDVIVNVVWMTIYLWELPKEWIVTARLNRHAAAGSGKNFDRCARIQDDYLKWYDTKHADGIHR